MGLLEALQYIQGNTPGQQAAAQRERFNAFIDNDLPGLANAIHSAATHDEVLRTAQEFFTKGLKAGMNPQQLDKLSEHLIQPALNNLAAGEYEKISKSLQPRTTYLDEANPGFRPLSEGENVSEMMPARPTTITPKFSQSHALDLGAVEARTGVKPPAGLAGLLDVPSRVQQQEAAANQATETARYRQAQQSREQTNQAIDELQRGELDKMEGEAGSVARASRGRGLGQYLDQERDRTQRAPLVQAQTETERARQGELGSRSRYNEAGITLRNSRAENVGAGGTETVSDRFVKPEEKLITERAIARTAVDRGVGKLPPEQRGAALAKIADEFGYQLEGDAALDEGSGTIAKMLLPQGLESPAKLAGDYTLTPKPKTTTKGKPGGNPKTPPPAGGEMAAMPDAAQNEGRTIRDTVTGKRYQAKNKKWVEIK